MNKNSRKLIISCLVFIIIALSISLYTKGKGSTQDENINIEVNTNNLLDEQKEYLKYNHQVPNDINVLDIISENKVLAEDSDELKIYDLKEEKFIESLVEVSKGSLFKSAKVFNEGIVWVESNGEKKAENKIFIKYFSDNKVNEIGEGNSDILPAISITENYLTYYIVDNNIVSINILNLKDGATKLIESYDVESDKGMVFVSQPNSNDNNVVWSATINDEFRVYIYNIQTGMTKTISEDIRIYCPVIKANRIFAIEKYDFYDSEIDLEYSKDFIAEYDSNTNTWSKFEKERIDDYMVSQSECITYLSTDNGYLYWLSPFFTRSVYDIEKSEFISLIDLNNKSVQVNVKKVKDNTIYYSCSDYEGRESNFIYSVPD